MAFNLFEKIAKILFGKKEESDDFTDILNLDDSETDILMPYQVCPK